MCRFLVYKGKDEILLSKLILDPAHSILTQSYDSRLRLDTRRPHNGDGFGVGYYTAPHLGPEPCIFTSTIPAWNSLNLSRLASKTTSPLIFAHVRASTQGNLAEQNCHPFRHGCLMFMHNGGIGCWNRVKRRLVSSVREKWFLNVQGSTDSEWAFALFLDSLEDEGVDPGCGQGRGVGHDVLRRALLKTIERINGFVEAVCAESKGTMSDGEEISLLNFAVTDGHSVVCSRYVSSKTDEAASLFFSSGTSWKAQHEGSTPKGNGVASSDSSALTSQDTHEAAAVFHDACPVSPAHKIARRLPRSRMKSSRNSRRAAAADRCSISPEPPAPTPTPPKGPANPTPIPPPSNKPITKPAYKMERRDKGSDIVLVASEPLTFERDNWVTVPTNSTLTIYKQTVLIHPVVDGFYRGKPVKGEAKREGRSEELAKERGQMVDKRGSVDGGDEMNGVNGDSDLPTDINGPDGANGVGTDGVSEASVLPLRPAPNSINGVNGVNGSNIANPSNNPHTPENSPTPPRRTPTTSQSLSGRRMPRV